MTNFNKRKDFSTFKSNINDSGDNNEKKNKNYHTWMGTFKNIGGNIPGGNILDGNFPEGSLIDGNFLNGIFPDTEKIYAKNSRVYIH